MIENQFYKINEIVHFQEIEKLAIYSKPPICSLCARFVLTSCSQSVLQDYIKHFQFSRIILGWNVITLTLNCQGKEKNRKKKNTLTLLTFLLNTNTYVIIKCQYLLLRIKELS